MRMLKQIDSIFVWILCTQLGKELIVCVHVHLCCNHYPYLFLKKFVNFVFYLEHIELVEMTLSKKDLNVLVPPFLLRFKIFTNLVEFK